MLDSNPSSEPLHNRRPGKATAIGEVHPGLRHRADTYLAPQLPIQRHHSSSSNPCECHNHVSGPVTRASEQQPGCLQLSKQPHIYHGRCGMSCSGWQGGHGLKSAARDTQSVQGWLYREKSLRTFICEGLARVSQYLVDAASRGFCMYPTEQPLSYFSILTQHCTHVVQFLTCSSSTGDWDNSIMRGQDIMGSSFLGTAVGTEVTMCRRMKLLAGCSSILTWESFRMSFKPSVCHTSAAYGALIQLSMRLWCNDIHYDQDSGPTQS